MTSVRSSIYAAMVTALGTITTGNGFNNTLASVQKVNYGQDDTQRPYLVVTFSRETKRDRTMETKECTITGSIFAYSEELNEDDSGSIEDKVDLLVSDVEKLVGQQMALGVPFGAAGLKAVEIGHAKYTLGEEIVQGAEIDLTVTYHHKSDDPDTP
jgi:hypothetical protein